MLRGLGCGKRRCWEPRHRSALLCSHAMLSTETRGEISELYRTSECCIYTKNRRSTWQYCRRNCEFIGHHWATWYLPSVYGPWHITDSRQKASLRWCASEICSRCRSAVALAMCSLGQPLTESPCGGKWTLNVLAHAETKMHLLLRGLLQFLFGLLQKLQAEQMTASWNALLKSKPRGNHRRRWYPHRCTASVTES